MKKWYRLTALVLAFAIVLSTVSGALAQVEVDYGDYQTWVEDTKAANGLAGVISIDEGGEVLVEPSTFTGETNAGPQYTAETTQTLNTYAEDNAPTIDVVLEQYGKVTLAAPAAGQWQAYLAAADLWVDITGETGSTFALTFAKVQSLFMANGHAQLRCQMGDAVTETVNVGMSYAMAVLPANTQEDAAATLMMAKSSGNDGIALAADEPELGEYSIVINYVFENGELVAEPYTATLAAGSDFSASVNHPTTMGYLPYVGTETETSTKIDINVTNIQADVTYTVTYRPTNVNYTVIHYQQNVDNDKYTIKETETKQGLTKSTVPEVAKSYDGFYALLYEKPEIAADGTTVVEIYYDRYYYLMNFELSGGYGVEPIYARYGAPVGTIATPKRAGYTFNGWSPAVPATVPVDGGTYTAQWTMNDTAKVTVVFWGENANDEKYSYIGSTTVECAPNSEYTFSSSTTSCPMIEHTHSSCENACAHVCELEICYETDYYDFIEVSASSLPAEITSQNPTEDKVYTYYTGSGWGRTDYYYLRLNGKWYTGSNYSGTKSNPERKIEKTCTHVCSDACYTCGKIAHTHSNTCQNLWTFVKSDTVKVAPDGSTVVNVYYDRKEFTLSFTRNSSTVKTITAKWGADIHSEFPIKNENGTIQWTVPSGCQSMAPGKEFASLDSMPAENITFKYYTADDAVTLHYYVEVLPGETGTYPHEGKNFKSYKDIDIQSGVYLTYTEEFHDILGFKQWWSDPAFDKHEQGGTTDYVYDDCILCYTRNGFDIVYFNPTTQLKADENVPYQMPLTTYYWEPTSAQAPAQYEPGSVKFDGWYLNPECTGEKFDFTKQTMPAGPNNVDGEVALSLYAKWVPVTHKVEFYLDLDDLNENTKIGDSHPDLTVAHGSKVETVPADPTNGSYKFVGWFYMDNGEEKAFDFANMPINRDMKVYGKWSSDVLKNYFVYFKIQGTDTQIAAPITGSALAGHTKTFDAKGGTDLYADYQEGYFPLVQSHSMTIDIENDANNVFTFWYVQKNAVPYTVYYVAETLKDGEDAADYQTIVRDGKTYYIIADTYTNSENRKAVVTEKFKVVTGYMPDAYQKRLVVDGTDGAVNEIIFYYSVDTTHAYYKITHYTQNTDGENWTEYASSQAVGDINSTYSADPLTIDGFTFDSSVTGTVTSGVLTANGLELKLYYVRNPYPYEVRYLKQGTGEELAEPKTGSGLYGEVVSESAIEITNYTPVEPTSQTLTIKIEKSQTEVTLNIITFYYTENEVTINYVVDGPTGCGTVDLNDGETTGKLTATSETVKVLSGTALGALAEETNNTYKFIGWYDAEGNLLSENADYKPTKGDGTAWVDGTTYYAKFEYNLTSMTIQKSGVDLNKDPNASFIFEVSGEGITGNLRVVIYGNGSATINGLTVGETYTVTEVDGNWRYGAYPKSVTSDELKPNAADNVVKFTNTRNPDRDQWLDSDSYRVNRFDINTGAENE